MPVPLEQKNGAYGTYFQCDYFHKQKNIPSVLFWDWANMAENMPKMEGNFRWDQLTVCFQPRFRDAPVRQRFISNEFYWVRKVSTKRRFDIRTDNNDWQAYHSCIDNAGCNLLFWEKKCFCIDHQRLTALQWW